MCAEWGCTHKCQTTVAMLTGFALLEGAVKVFNANQWQNSSSNAVCFSDVAESLRYTSAEVMQSAAATNSHEKEVSFWIFLFMDRF